MMSGFITSFTFRVRLIAISPSLVALSANSDATLEFGERRRFDRWKLKYEPLQCERDRVNAARHASCQPLRRDIHVFRVERSRRVRIRARGCEFSQHHRR
jgi:hypothetical protein